MEIFAKEVLPINIEDEMRNSYMEYAMSVIVGRALPDARDGLKPVHRRVLYAMHVLGNDWNKPYKKSARIVGDVIGKYHPHGDTAVYDALVRMAQPFSMRYVQIDGQGNFGSVDGDAPAAMRYTEVRMSKLAHELLADLDKETVDFNTNYDETEREPSVLPSRIPNLLINGSSGIAVGIATNVPPHNLTEVVNACLALIDSPDIELPELMQHIPGPDFPTAGIINGAMGIHEAYKTGKGRIYIRARTHIETDESSGKESIIVTELPYQVNKARLLEKIAELVKDKKLEGITELRDESDKDGMRMVIELRRGEVLDVVLNNLYQQTQMQNVFGINMVALIDGQPQLLTLKSILVAFIRHRREVVTRRTLYELRKARDRAHILEGLAVALTNIDPIIALIKASPTSAEARTALLENFWEPGVVLDMLGRAGAQMSRPEELSEACGLVEGRYYLSPVQAQAILEMRLNRLTGLEKDKILGEYRELLDKIEALLLIISDPQRLMQVIREELEEVVKTFGDERRTEIVITHADLSIEDLITEESMVVTISHAGYVKSQPTSEYSSQKRGGRGKTATRMKDEDFIDKLFVASSHDTVLCFSSRGKVYWKKVYEMPQASRTARGRPIVNLLPLEEGERINAILPIRAFESDKFIFMATSHGTIKKMALTMFAKPRPSGLIAVGLKDDDQLVGVAITNGDQDVMLFSSAGQAVRFHEKLVRSMGRTACGVRGIRLTDDQHLIALIIPTDEGEVLIATTNGYGKRTAISDFPTHSNRGGLGVKAIQTGERNGDVIGAVMVADDDEIMLISDGGVLVRTPAGDISVVGRNTKGVRLINLSDNEKLVGLERVCEIDVAADTNGDDANGDDANGDDANGDDANGDDASEGETEV